jgi:hypothetical protein
MYNVYGLTIVNDLFILASQVDACPITRKNLIAAYTAAVDYFSKLFTRPRNCNESQECDCMVLWFYGSVQLAHVQGRSDRALG